ncbi:MAG: hypothetical protein EP318_15555 [Rhodobacteraceae bacterium]|nr:MAG: hypothetical protein EP318_15555 [Paracoccaceae bacterium]
MTHPLETSADLRRARAVIADVTSHDDAALSRACQTVIDLSPDVEERDRAGDLLAIVQGEAA